MKIKLSSSIYEVVEIKRKTKAKLFGDIKVGDLIHFSMNMRAVGRGRSGLYASTVTVTNITQDVSDSSKSQTEVSNILDCFELKEVM